MSKTTYVINSWKLKVLHIKNHNSILIIQGGTSAGMKHFIGQDNLLVITGRPHIVKSLCMRVTKNMLAKILPFVVLRYIAWIANGRNLATKTCKSSVCCPHLRKLQQNQKMADICDTLPSPFPSFTDVGLDLPGLINIVAMADERAIKVWVVVFMCQNYETLSMAPGYSINDFILTYSYHVKPKRGIWICTFRRGS